MLKTWKILFPIFLALSLTFVTVVRVSAQPTYPFINYEILPSQGGANTTIILRFTTTSPNVSNVQTADIFWDNNTVALNQSGFLGASGAYDYNLTVPTEPPLSDEGNHTIQVDSNVANYGPISFFFTFNITEFVPSPEYIALNETYYSLLTNYTDILGNYTQLQSDYAVLFENYTTALAENANDTQNYNTLVSTYNVLDSNYNSLTANYNLLSTTYSNLTTNYISMSSNYALLQQNYALLQTNFQTLDANYSTLILDYNLLNSSYAGLLSNYNGLTGQLAFSRNLNITLIIITIILAIITIYYVILKPKTPTKTR